jgi:hypothetical protein
MRNATRAPAPRTKRRDEPKPDRSFILIKPCALQPKGFHPPEAGEQQETDRGEPSRVLPVLRTGAKRLAKPLDLFATEPPFARLGSELANPFGGVGFDLAKPHAMLKDRVQGRHGSRRDAFAAGGGAAAAADPRFRSLAGRNVGYLAQLEPIFEGMRKAGVPVGKPAQAKSIARSPPTPPMSTHSSGRRGQTCPQACISL